MQNEIGLIFRYMKLKISVSHETVGSAEAQHIKTWLWFLHNLHPKFSLAVNTHKDTSLPTWVASSKIKEVRNLGLNVTVTVCPSVTWAKCLPIVFLGDLRSGYSTAVKYICRFQCIRESFVTLPLQRTTTKLSGPPGMGTGWRKRKDKESRWLIAGDECGSKMDQPIVSSATVPVQ